MKKFALLTAIACFCATPALADMTVPFVNNLGEKVGTATLRETGEGVSVILNVTDAPPGLRAMHFHQVGECSPRDTFENAGEHLNPFGKDHGKLSEAGAHAGDMDNIEVSASGTVQTVLVNPHVTMGTENTDHEAALRDKDGSALIIHGGRDDYKTQPSGESGNRWACAEIH